MEDALRIVLSKIDQLPCHASCKGDTILLSKLASCVGFEDAFDSVHCGLVREKIQISEFFFFEQNDDVAALVRAISTGKRLKVEVLHFRIRRSLPPAELWHHVFDHSNTFSKTVPSLAEGR
jgi:hypothetical protein